jgi:clan AA aspartic protease
MIEGMVSFRRDAVVEVTVSGSASQAERVACVVDTGYDGALTLPEAITAKLGLEPAGVGRSVLGDGKTVSYPMYEAFVTWDGAPRRVVVDAAETEPLLGMALMEGFEVCIEVVAGGRVRIARLAEST